MLPLLTKPHQELGGIRFAAEKQSNSISVHLILVRKTRRVARWYI
jgi:hypothetical protein